jgi:hypothetical protein
MGVMTWKSPTAIEGTMDHAKTSFSTGICAGAIISVVQYLAPLRYIACSEALKWAWAMSSDGVHSIF